MDIKKPFLFLFMIACGCHSFSQIKKLPKVDSIPSKVAPVILQDEKNIYSEYKKQLASSLFDSVKYMKKMVLAAPKAFFENPVKLVNGRIDYRGIADNSLLYGNQYLGNFDAETDWLIFSVPVDIRYRNQSWSDVRTFQPGQISFQYDRNNYLQQLRNKLKTKFKSEDFIQKITDPLLDAKQNAERLLQNDLQRINTQYKNSLSGIIKKIGDPANLFNKESSSLRQQMLNTGYLKSIKEKENLYSQLIQKKNSGEKIDAKQLESLDSSLREEKGMESLLNKIEEHKHRWDSSGLIKKMKEWNLFQKQSLAKFAQDPSTTIKAAKQFLNLNSFQKLFLKIDKLNLGENAFSLSPLSIQHFLNNGVVTQFLNNKHYLMLMNSKQEDYNSLLDMPYSNNIFSNTGVAKSISYGTGMNSASHSHITLATYTQTLSSINIPAALNSFRRSLVTTISNEMNIGKNGEITTEISRSSTDYVNDTAGQGALKKILSPDNFWKNTSFSVNYADQYLKPNLSYQIHVSKTANGYDNPGNIFLNSGSKEFGYAIKKTFWNKKLQFNVRSNLRQFKYNDLLDERWRSIYSVLDMRFKLRKGQYISLRYLPSKMIRLDSSSKSTATEINMLTVEGNLTKKVMRGYYHNYLSLSSQKNGYSLNNEWVLTRTILFSSSQTLSVGKKLIYLNMNYNYADNHSSFVYFNSSFVTEAGSSFILLKKINASSSLTYNSIKGWYEQIGIRQTFTTQFAKRFNMSVYGDARKNIHVYQPLWGGLYRVDASIHYQLKN